jgi:regulator of protease activity HflC (stomatin/prohibitin superfamily)
MTPRQAAKRQLAIQDAKAQLRAEGEAAAERAQARAERQAELRTRRLENGESDGIRWGRIAVITAVSIACYWVWPPLTLVGLTVVGTALVVALIAKAKGY